MKEAELSPYEDDSLCHRYRCQVSKKTTEPEDSGTDLKAIVSYKQPTTILV